MTYPALSDRVWARRARVERLIDGDSAHVVLDLGLSLTASITVRLDGIDTPEIRRTTGVIDDESARGLQARDFAALWLAHASTTPGLQPWPLVIETVVQDKYGRWLAIVWRRGDGRCLNQDLLEAGHAREYHGGARG